MDADFRNFSCSGRLLRLDDYTVVIDAKKEQISSILHHDHLFAQLDFFPRILPFKWARSFRNIAQCAVFYGDNFFFFQFMEFPWNFHEWPRDLGTLKSIRSISPPNLFYINLGFESKKILWKIAQIPAELFGTSSRNLLKKFWNVRLGCVPRVQFQLSKIKLFTQNQKYTFFVK